MLLNEISLVKILTENVLLTSDYCLVELTISLMILEITIFP
jgi:hypothetical protein